VAGPILVAIAAILWATDALFRAPLLNSVSPMLIVLFAHAVGAVVLGIWVFIRYRNSIGGFSLWTWFCLFLIGAGGSGIATVLYTASFEHINPSVAILLQKLQPLLVVIFAFIFLREKPKRSFWAWALVALLATVVVSFPDFDFSFISHGIDWRSTGVIYAISAAALWALSTVAGKAVLGKVPPSIVTFWRYVFGFLALIALVTVAKETMPSASVLRAPSIWHGLLYIALVPGILALVFYYHGLKRTAATTTTFVELLFPICAVVLNWIFLNATLRPVQIVAGVVLIYAVTRISTAK